MTKSARRRPGYEAVKINVHAGVHKARGLVHPLSPRLDFTMGARFSYPTVDLKDKVSVVTGGNQGIGYNTARTLAAMGSHVIIGCRSEERATQV